MSKTNYSAKIVYTPMVVELTSAQWDYLRAQPNRRIADLGPYLQASSGPDISRVCDGKRFYFVDGNCDLMDYGDTPPDMDVLRRLLDELALAVSKRGIGLIPTSKGLIEVRGQI